MNIDSNGLPIHSNATAAIRSRIFLEGNFYVDLSPGSPSAPMLASGATLPAPSTSGPVQLDRVLSALNIDARANLQTLLQGIGGALNDVPTAAADATQDPSVRGLTRRAGVEPVAAYSVGAFRGLGDRQPGAARDPAARPVERGCGNEEVFKALAASGPQLGSFVHTFNATLAALAARQSALARTIAAPAGAAAHDRCLRHAARPFVPTDPRVREGDPPGVEQTDPTVGAALPWLAQATALASPGRARRVCSPT